MKICAVTCNRSEYGLLKWILRELKDDEYFDLQIIVSGAHLIKEFGYTINEIKSDGFNINCIIENYNDLNTKNKIVKSMGRFQLELADCLINLKPDLILILGDRYELIPISYSALLLDIPVAHISGGDITEGAMDDQIRHAVTKLSTLHFPGTESSRERLLQMGESPYNVFTVGEPGLDGLFRNTLPERLYLSHDLKLSLNKKWIIGTYHPETRNDIDKDIDIINKVLEYLRKKEDFEILFTSANTDYGGAEINSIIRKYTKYDNIHFVENLGQKRYLGFLKESVLMIGNSSSGLTEAPSLYLPVINIGDRQKGRIVPGNVINVGKKTDLIIEAIEKGLSKSFYDSCKFISNPYGDGKTSVRIKEILKKINLNRCVENKKRFNRICQK